MEESRLYTRRAELLPVDVVEAEARPVFPDETEVLIDVSRYWRTVRKHLGLALAIVLVAVVLALLHVMSETPIYTAETTIEIEPNAGRGSNGLENLVEVETAAANADQYHKTQCTILQTRKLAIEVIRDLGLGHNPVFAGTPHKPGPLTRFWSSATGGLEGLLAQGERAPQETPSREEPLLAEAESRVPPSLVHAYLGMLKVSTVPDTTLVKIAFATPDPGLSAELANAHVVAYQRTQIEMHGEQGEESQRFLQNKLVEIKEQLEKSEAALNEYRRRKGIIPGLISLDGKDAVVLDRLADLSKDFTHAQVDRIGLESEVQLIRRHEYKSLPAVMQDGAIQGLDKELNDLYTEDAALSSQFKSDYPPLKKLQAKIHEVQTQFAAEIGEVVEGILSAYQQALEKENELQAEMGRQRAETMNLNDAAAQYAILQRDVDTNRQLYDAFLTRMKDIAVTSGAESSNVSVINSAEVPTSPTSPQKARELMLGLVLGLCGGLGLTFLLEFLDNTIKNPEDAEHFLRLPSLGVVPEFSSINRRAPYSAYETRQLSGNRLPGNRPTGSLPPGRELVTSHGSYSTLGEAYRNLRTALLLSRAGTPPKVTMITSASSHEGKTVTSANTAAMLAQLGEKTLLIDADLRRARCHRVLALDNNLGLTEVLTGSRELHETIRPTEIENLYFLSSGSAPPNPTELLGSNKMAETLTRLREHYTYIVIDSSPVLPVSDSLLLAKMVDGIMVVVDGAATPRQQVKAACARIEYARGKILGVLLNKIKIHSHEYQNYYHQEYYSTHRDSTQDEEEPT